MDRTMVRSSDIRSIGYDKLATVLEVEFVSGGIYQYFNVPEYVHHALMNAPSHGKFLNNNIKYNYRYQKIR